MKNLLISVVVIFLLLLSINVQAGQPLGSRQHWLAQPNSKAFGMPLDEWTEAHLRWLEDGADPAARIGKVAFLPIDCVSSSCNFEVEVEAGTPFVLPVATWLGSTVNDTLPDDWFGDTNHVWGTLQFDGGPIKEINGDYYVGPTLLEPPADLFETDIYLYQALACVILPLPPGVHEVLLHSEFVDYGVEFDNTWIITVVP